MYDELYTLLNRITQGNTDWHGDVFKIAVKKPTSMIEVNSVMTLAA